MKTANRTHRARSDTTALEQKVKAMYRDVALDPQGGSTSRWDGARGAARLCARRPRCHPERSHRLVSGVGYYFDLARLKPGETVVDLGSGSGRTLHRRRARSARLAL